MSNFCYSLSDLPVFILHFLGIFVIGGDDTETGNDLKILMVNWIIPVLFLFKGIIATVGTRFEIII
jgi:hypothetical protein